VGTSITPSGMDVSAAALRYWEQRQNIASSNIANVSTDGFKGQRAFAQLMGDGASPTISTATDLSAGPMSTTGAPLDLAIQGAGFIVVQTANGERLSRGGSMQINAQHQLADRTGNPVLGQADAAGGIAGPVTIPAGTAHLTIDAGGTVIADGKQVARLRLEQAPAGSQLQHDTNGLFIPSASMTSIPAAQGTIRQGAIEQSNVSSVGSMVDMIAIQRAYANVQKVLTTMDAAREIATTEIGKPN
jgi:flagellar basal-body rod protein FlgF